MATVKGAGMIVPAPSSRPGSASFADAYGALGLTTSDVPSTRQAGGEGAVKAAGSAAAAGRAPITVNGIGPDFLTQPAGVLVLAIVGLAVWSYLEKKG